MNEQTDIERKRQQARDRKRAQRERQRRHRETMEVSEYRMEMYKGTRAALERICEAGGFSESAELLTLLIHNLDSVAQCDSSRFAELVSVRGHAWLGENTHCEEATGYG